MFIRHERSIKEFMKLYPIVSTIIIINLSLWLISFLQLGIATDIREFGIGVNLFVAQGEYWRLVTPIFLHGGTMHALFNSFALVLFGPALEQMIGKYKFIFFYLGAGIIGNIGTYIFAPLIYVHLGASGSVYGLFGAYMFMALFRKRLIDQDSSQMIMVIFGVGVLMSVIGPNINISAHLAGFAGGFILAPLVLINASPYNPFRAFQRSYPDNNGEIGFDPNRWNKKRRIPNKLKANWLWIIIGILALIGLISRF